MINKTYKRCLLLKIPFFTYYFVKIKMLSVEWEKGPSRHFQSNISKHVKHVEGQLNNIC